MSTKEQSASTLPVVLTVEDTSSMSNLEARVLRKLDWRVLPCVSLFYLLAFLDRANIGNANVAGLSKDLKLQGLQYNVCVALFFVTDAFFEVPANIVLKLTRPSFWIPTIMFIWGVIMMSMAFVKNYSGLLAARFFLGVAEAGLLPGVTFYLCLWYPRDALARRMTIFFSASELAGAFGGILAYGIEKLNGVSGLAGWSWIFLLEGLATIFVSLLAYFYMPDYPETATFLSSEEKEFMLGRLKGSNAGLAKHFDRDFIAQALSDPRSWLQAILYLAVIIPNYAFALFLPSIIAGLGFSAANAQLLSVPPYVFGCFFLVVYGILSDRYQMRGPFIFVGATIGLIGFIILYTTSSPGPGYAGACIAACGLVPALACVIVWAGGNAGGEVKRAVVLALVIGIGNLGGIASSFIYRAQDSPRYHPGHAVVIGCLCVVMVTSVVGMLEYSRLNKAKEAYCREHEISEDKQEEFSAMGDRSPLFRYTL